MSKLDAFLAKLAAKKRQMERQQRRDRGEPSSSESDSDSDDEKDPTAPSDDASASIYGSKAYWDKRYGDGCTIGGRAGGACLSIREEIWEQDGGGKGRGVGPALAL